MITLLSCVGTQKFTFPPDSLVPAFGAVAVSVSGASSTFVWKPASVDALSDVISLKHAGGGVVVRCS
jgi:hypothetical protein